MVLLYCSTTNHTGGPSITLLSLSTRTVVTLSSLSTRTVVPHTKYHNTTKWVESHLFFVLLFFRIEKARTWTEHVPLKVWWLFLATLFFLKGWYKLVMDVPLYIPTERSHIQSPPMEFLSLTELWNMYLGRKPATTGVYTWIIWSDSFHDERYLTSGSIHGTLHHNRPHMLSVMVCHLPLYSHKFFVISPGFFLFFAYTMTFCDWFSCMTIVRIVIWLENWPRNLISFVSFELSGD